MGSRSTHWIQPQLKARTLAIRRRCGWTQAIAFTQWTRTKIASVCFKSADRISGNANDYRRIRGTGSPESESAWLCLLRITFICPHDSNAVVGKLIVHLLDVHFFHVAGNAILGAGRASSARKCCRFLLAGTHVAAGADSVIG